MADEPIVTIRPATKGDSEGIVATVREVFEEYGFAWDKDDYCADLYDVEAHYLAKGNLFWVAEVGGVVVGTVGLEFFGKVAGELGGVTILDGKVRVAGSDCSLERLYVRPSARGQGLGRALTELVINEAHARGREAMEIWSDKKLEDAHRLYGKFGASVVGERICDDPDESPEWGMLLVL